MDNLLSQGSWWILNKKFTQQYGLEVSILLSDLLARYIYWSERQQLQDGWFFCVKEDIENDTTLSSYKQNEALKTLVKLGIIQTKLHGVPPKTYYFIDHRRVNEVVSALYFKSEKF